MSVCFAVLMAANDSDKSSLSDTYRMFRDLIESVKGTVHPKINLDVFILPVVLNESRLINSTTSKKVGMYFRFFGG